MRLKPSIATSLILLTLLILGRGLQAAEQDPPELVWVAVSVLDLGQDEASEYNGQVRRSELEGVLASTTEGGWLTLERVHWHMDNGIAEQSRIGQEWGYSDRSHFPLNRITRIIPLSTARAALLDGRLPPVQAP